MEDFIFEIIDTTSENLGVAKKDSKVFFIPHTVTGDKVRARVIEDKKTYSICDLVEVLEKSPKRVEPLCPHFTNCGGCDFLNVEQETEEEIKKKNFITTFKKITKTDLPEDIHIVSSPKEFHYRNRAKFHVRNSKIGFFKYHSNDIVEIDMCPLLEEPINSVLKSLKDFKVNDFHSIEMTLCEKTGKVVIYFLSDRKVKIDFSLNSFDKSLVKAVACIAKDKRKRHDRGKEYFTDGDTSVTYLIDDYDIITSGRSFIQSNYSANYLLFDTLSSFLNDTEERSEKTLLELFSGSGNFTLPLAKYFKKVFTVESDRLLVSYLKENARTYEIDNIKVKIADLYRDLSTLENIPVDSLFLDPPRQGMGKQLLAFVESKMPKEILYVSCSAQSYSKDFLFLHNLGYNISKLSIVDMFPKTRHIESISLLKLN